MNDERGYRMVVFIIRDDSKPGGLDVRTDWLYSNMEFCQNHVNSVLPKYGRRMIGWKITDICPMIGEKNGQ